LERLFVCLCLLTPGSRRLQLHRGVSRRASYATLQVEAIASDSFALGLALRERTKETGGGEKGVRAAALQLKIPAGEGPASGENSTVLEGFCSRIFLGN